MVWENWEAMYRRGITFKCRFDDRKIPPQLQDAKDKTKISP